MAQCLEEELAGTVRNSVAQVVVCTGTATASQSPIRLVVVCMWKLCTELAGPRESVAERPRQDSLEQENQYFSDARAVDAQRNKIATVVAAFQARSIVRGLWMSDW